MANWKLAAQRGATVSMKAASACPLPPHMYSTPSGAMRIGGLLTTAALACAARTYKGIASHRWRQGELAVFMDGFNLHPFDSTRGSPCSVQARPMRTSL